NTLSLGGDIGCDELALSKNGNDLVLQFCERDSVTLKDWYTDSSYQTLFKLQLMIDTIGGFVPKSGDPLHSQRIQTFDFLVLVNKFDRARATNANLDQWLMMDGLLDAHLAASDTEAIGGDLAYYYGLNDALTGIGLASAQRVISAPGFGRDAQFLHPLTG